MRRVSARKIAGWLGVLFVVAMSPIRAAPADHVVPQDEIQRTVSHAARVRQGNLEAVQRFFASPQAQKALKKGGVDYARVEKAVPTLSDDDLARLATRVNSAQGRFAAGSLSNEQLTYIVIALATAVIVILIVKA